MIENGLVSRRNLLRAGIVGAGAAVVAGGALLLQPSDEPLDPGTKVFKNLFFSVMKDTSENLGLWRFIQDLSKSGSTDYNIHTTDIPILKATTYRVRLPNNPHYRSGLGFTSDFPSYDLNATINSDPKTQLVTWTSVAFYIDKQGRIGLPASDDRFSGQELTEAVRRYTREPYPRDFRYLDYINFYGQQVGAYTAEFGYDGRSRRFTLWRDGQLSISHRPPNSSSQ